MVAPRFQDLSPVDLTGKQGKEGKEEPGHNKTQKMVTSL
jgi:hypothetical protein